MRCCSLCWYKLNPSSTSSHKLWSTHNGIRTPRMIWKQFKWKTNEPKNKIRRNSRSWCYCHVFFISIVRYTVDSWFSRLVLSISYSVVLYISLRALSAQLISVEYFCASNEAKNGEREKCENTMCFVWILFYFFLSRKTLFYCAPETSVEMNLVSHNVFTMNLSY